jgi:prepilin-type N-terminal cleavage/methylation domain-containing protein
MNQRGFTLVEILVVLAIVAILATLTIGSYGNYRKGVAVDIAGDSLVSQLNELRAKTVYGELDSARRGEIVRELDGGEVAAVPANVAAGCYGLVLESDGAGAFGAPQSFEDKFANNKVWDGEANDFVYQGCNDVTRELRVLEWDKKVLIDGVVVFSGARETEVDRSLILRFVPPKGEFEVSLDDGLTFSNVIAGDKIEKFVFEISFDDANGSRYERVVEYNLN